MDAAGLCSAKTAADGDSRMDAKTSVFRVFITVSGKGSATNFLV
jgi:hypothetical protein